MEKIAIKEKKRTDLAFSELKLIDERGRDLLELARSYKQDADFFFGKKKWFESIEIYSYLFGILDSLARLKMIDPGKARPHYKIEQ